MDKAIICFQKPWTVVSCPITKLVCWKWLRLKSCRDPTQNVATMLSNARKELVSRNTQVIKSLLKCVAFCGKQGLSFWGHKDDSTASDSDNTGNFVQLVQSRAENDDVLGTYLETAPRNALYTSKTIQDIRYRQCRTRRHWRDSYCEVFYHFSWWSNWLPT